VRASPKRRIAREVHDELGQALSVLKIDVRCLGDAVNGDDLGLREQIEAIAGGPDATVQAVRKICSELRPATLYHFGLPAAVEWQAREFQKKTGIECVTDLGTEDLDLDHDLGLAVFRMFQEALTNIMRHACADEGCGCRRHSGLNLRPGFHQARRTARRIRIARFLC
jgi:signal transduction histidine kinase